MKQLNKYKLNFDPTWEYVKNNLENATTLSSKLLSLLDFGKGHFFTLLPNDANIERLYEFEDGIILPQNPEQQYFILGEIATYSITPTIAEELSELILKEVGFKDELCCVFDDVLRSRTDKHQPDLFYTHGLFYDNEVYYLLERDKISSELIMQCLRASDAFWHSLCVLTKTSFKNKINKKLSLEKINDICLNTDLIIIGAYDGEGYIFWEKENKLMENFGQCNSD